MSDPLLIHRLQFAFTITFHYLFPQLTMGLALLVAVLKTGAFFRGDARLDAAAQFWGRILGVNFVIGVVTGIPMEFQFGTNWARFSAFAGGVIGQTLAMESVFAFFLESTFLGLFLYGAGRVSPFVHWLSAVLLWLGTWVSGYFIVVTNAFMQHPVGYRVEPDGRLALESLSQLLSNPWAIWQYAHTMIGAVQTGCFVMAGIGAFYLLSGKHEDQARLFVRTGVAIGLVASLLQIMPTGDVQGRLVADHQPATLAALEGLFETGPGAPLALVGQPDTERRRLDNPLLVPRALSFLTYRRWMATVKGLDSFPEDEWPTNVPLVYYAYHIMVGLGTIFIAIQAAAAWLLRGGRLFTPRWRSMLWVLMLALPFPYVANTAGWIAAEAGRQPWMVYGLFRTAEGSSEQVVGGNALFTLLGFTGLYALLALVFLFLAAREIAHGPRGAPLEPDAR
jgi:cytochrome d ubiquinol oxidase subunit I